MGFGVFGLAVVAERVEAGELVVEVESPRGQAVFCAGCGVRARSKGRCPVVLRDAEAAGSVPVRVLWNKRVWACPDSGCEAKTWTEQSGLAGPRRVLTWRAGEWAAGRLAVVEGSVTGLARRLGVGWQTLWAAISPIAQQAVDDPGRVAFGARVGFDETVMSSATRRRRRRFVSAAVGAGTGQIMDVFDGRDAADLERWAHQQPDGQMAAVEVVCLDPHEGYRKAVRALKAEGVLGSNVRVAADPFHIVRLANRALDDCRRRTQNDTT
ncbi:MAG: transposase [bacterium]|nr:transposase [bacterium]